MFVTFMESQSIPRGCEEHNGATVSILSKGVSDMYKVGRWDHRGKWVTWTAHVDELIGFDAEVAVRT